MVKSLKGYIVKSAVCIAVALLAGCVNCDDLLQPFRNQVAAAQKRADTAEKKVQAAQAEKAELVNELANARIENGKLQQEVTSLHQVITSVQEDVCE